MNIDIKEHLNPKVVHHCLRLFENKHYPECAHTAMKQVEINFNKKCGLKSFTPIVKTIKKIFKLGKGVRLKVPFGEEEQEYAQELFKGAFKYYRNYTAHQQDNITMDIALRVMFIASELLDLLDACSLNLEELGDIKEIKNVLGIDDNNRLEELLSFVDGSWIADDVCDGFFEDLAMRGFTDDQYEKLFELNIVCYEEKPYKPDESELEPPERIGFFELTDIGKELLKEFKAEVK